MMNDAPAPANTNEDWLSSPAPAPKAIGAPAHQAAKPKGKAKPAAKPAAQKPAAKPKPAKGSVDELADQLRGAPVAADPGAAPIPDDAPFSGDPGPQSADPGPSDPGAAPPPGRGSGRPKGEIWDGCPVKPLGVNEDFFFFLDRHGQMRQTKAEMKASQILGYFGRIDLLKTRFPKYAKGAETPEPRNFNSQAANFTMIEACFERGLFNPTGAVRGVGAWAADDGSLIYHTGASLITAGGAKEPGEIDGRIYPAYPAIPEPAAPSARATPGEDILAQASTWRFSRPEVDPMLAVGMIGCMILGGALIWRPAFWFTGDRASGKSTLHDWINALMGLRGLIQASDATKSGITSQIGMSSLPVAIDELEPGEEGSQRERDIITLMRVSSSGGQWVRGTADQKGASGNVYSTFMFSSILIPGVMKTQDRSRIVIFDMLPPPADAPKPALDPRTWRARGAALKRVLIDRWPTWSARLQVWREALAAHDLTGRNGDNWATVMAMADMALSAELPAADHVDIWARRVAFAARGQVAEIGTNAEDMLMHLIGQSYDVYRRGEQWLVAHWLMVAAELPAAPRELVAGDGAVVDEVTRSDAARRANEKLAKIGLRVKGVGSEAELFLPNRAIPGLCRLFEHSEWRNGVWAQAARRIPGAKPTESPLKLAGQQTRGVYVPFTSIAGLLSLPMDRAKPAPTPSPAEDDWGDLA